MKRREILRGLVVAVGSAALCRAWGATAKRQLDSVDFGFISSKMTFMPRSEWTDTAPKAWRVRAAGNYDRVTVHHVGQATNVHKDKNAVVHDLDGVLATHLDRNFGDIGYHLAVDYSGRIWGCRSLAYEGAHVADQNETNIGVVLLGNFEEQVAGKEQLAAMAKLVVLLRERYRIKKHRVYGHRDLGKTACPGKHLYPHVAKLRA